MAVRAQGFSLFLSDICYALSHHVLFSLPSVAGSLDRDRCQRVAHLL